MPTPQFVAMLLARRLANERWAAESLRQRLRQMLGRELVWMHPLVADLLEQFPSRRPSVEMMEAAIVGNHAFQKGYRQSKRVQSLWFKSSAPAKMSPAAGALERWEAPPLVSVADFSQWIGVSAEKLHWLANHQTAFRANANAWHYRWRWIKKRNGGARLLAAPKRLLKHVQREILYGILQHIPPHDSAHGFRKRRGIVSFTAPHVERAMVVRCDLCDFFPSVGQGRARAIFGAAGYPEEVASLLAKLCTVFTPRHVWKDFPSTDPRLVKSSMETYEQAVLPQGAPTSPTLANLAAFRLDCRLNGLAKSAGASYTRYADDLLFSGDELFARTANRFANHVAAIVLEEGFRLNFRKTRIMRQGVRQHAAGITLNSHANPSRREFDRLRAIIYNCVSHGPASQNRIGHPNFRAHLAGCIAHFAMINPARATKLTRLFEQIEWDAGSSDLATD